MHGYLYIGAASFVIFVSVAGFGPSLVDQSRRTLPLDALVGAHGVVTSAWLLLFLVQASLVAIRRTAAHRRLGATGAILTLAMIVIGTLTTIEGARRGYDLSGDLGRAVAPPDSPPPTREDFVAGMFAPLLGFVGFGALVAAGLWFRHRPEIHKRLMLLALLVLTGVPLLHLSGYVIGHWPKMYESMSIAVPLTANLLLFAGAVHDKLTLGRIHPVSLWMPLVWIGGTALLLAVVQPSATWRQVAQWLVGS
jgi:hypothetical protein